MTTLGRVMFGALWLAALAAAIICLRNCGGARAVLALAPLLAAVLATSFYPTRA